VQLRELIILSFINKTIAAKINNLIPWNLDIKKKKKKLHYQQKKKKNNYPSYH